MRARRLVERHRVTHLDIHRAEEFVTDRDAALLEAVVEAALKWRDNELTDDNLCDVLEVFEDDLARAKVGGK